MATNYPILPPIGIGAWPDGYDVSSDKEWIDKVFWARDLFINYKTKNNIKPADSVFVTGEYGIPGIQYEDSKRYIAGGYPPAPVYASLGDYSLYDVLSGRENVKVSPSRTVYNKREILQPVISYEPLYSITGVPIGWLVQLGNYLIGWLADDESLDLVIKLRNKGVTSTASTGYVDPTSPPGYAVADSPLPYIVSWRKTSDSVIEYTYSDGTITNSTLVTGVREESLVLEDTIETVVADPDGESNSSTTCCIPIQTKDSLVITASSYVIGSEPWKAADHVEATGWVASNDTDQWILYDAGVGGQTINKFWFFAHPTIAHSSPKRFSIEGSQGEFWSELYTTYKNAPYRELDVGEQSDYFAFTNSISYRYYRVYIFESYGEV